MTLPPESGRYRVFNWTVLGLICYMLDCCTFQTPFDAVVDQVYFPTGLCAGELDIVRISQLSPMGIKVKMDRSTALGVTMETPISVFPCNSGEPVGVFHGASYLLPDGIMPGAPKEKQPGRKNARLFG